MRRIAVFLPNWIGDAVMATPAVRALKYHFHDAKLIALGRRGVLDALAHSPWFDDLITFDKRGFLGTYSKLKAHKPDAAILFPNSLRSAVMANVAGCRTVVGFARYGRDALLTHRLYAARDHRGGFKPTPIIGDYNRIVERLGVPSPGHQLELFTSYADDATAEQFWASAQLHRFANVVGLNPGGAFGAGKHWPHFAELANGLARRGQGVVVLCGPSEREEAIRIAAEAKHPHVVSVSVPPSLGLTKALVKRLSLLVTTDSGPRHFAHAFDVPVVSVFGPTHIAWTETYFAKAVHLQEHVPCGPCQQRTCPLGHHQCMTQLTPQRVLAASVDLLKRFQPEARDAG